MLMRIQEPAASAHRPQLRAFLELGFRPLYLAGASWAAIAVLLWIFFPQAINGLMQGMVWHAHEMLWGFVITIAIGFLMTAGANWTGINPLPGTALALACLFWLAARMGYLLPGELAFWGAALAESLFILSAALGMLAAVIKANNHRNLGVPIVLMALGAMNLLFLMATHAGQYEEVLRHFYAGVLLMAMLVLLIGRRVIPFFAMRAVPGLDIPKHTRSGQIQLALTATAVLGTLAHQTYLAAITLAAVGAISIWQVMDWKPVAVKGRPILWVLYLGYGVCGIGLMAAAIRIIDPGQRAAWSVHTIAMGGFAVLVMGMITRTALGHLGRALALSPSMVACYWLVIVAAVLRLLALMPSIASGWLLKGAAVAWIAAFAMYVREFFPMMIRARPEPTAMVSKSSSQQS